MYITHTYQPLLKAPDNFQGIEELKKNELCFKFYTIITTFFRKNSLFVDLVLLFCRLPSIQQFNNR